MRKVVAAINMTIDGYCDHTETVADDELHQHFTDLLNSGDVILYGRTTYQLMEDYWPNLVKNPSGNKADDDFASAMERISKIVFSNSLKKINWDSARLATRSLEAEIAELRKQPGRDIFIGSPSLIVQATNLNLVDEFQLNVQPIIAGKGLPLFTEITSKKELKFVKSKKFGSGAMMMYYEARK